MARPSSFSQLLITLIAVAGIFFTARYFLGVPGQPVIAPQVQRDWSDAILIAVGKLAITFVVIVAGVLWMLKKGNPEKPVLISLNDLLDKLAAVARGEKFD